jgi:hypothetical protein
MGNNKYFMKNDKYFLIIFSKSSFAGYLQLIKQMLGNCEENAGPSSQLYFLPRYFYNSLEKCHGLWRHIRRIALP